MTLQEAHKLVLRKWRDIRDGKGWDRSGSNCAFCQKFEHEGCPACPICQATGESECKDTPYWDFRDADDAFVVRDKRGCYTCCAVGGPESYAAACEMVKFLENLPIPEEP